VGGEVRNMTQEAVPRPSLQPEKILATHMRKGTRLTLVWAPIWLIRPCVRSIFILYFT